MQIAKSKMQNAKCGRSAGGAHALGLRPDSRYATLCYRIFHARLGSARPRGMTLIELLVVIVILTTIVAAAIPLVSPSNDDRRLREAARGLNTYITGAQTRAIATNRPWGVAFKRLSKDTNTKADKDTNPSSNIHPDNGVSLEAYYVEQQPPYAGFDANSRAMVAIYPNPPAKLPKACLIRLVTRGLTGTNLPRGWSADLFPNGTIRPGDVIEVGGTRFELLNPQLYNGSLASVVVDNIYGAGYFREVGLVATFLAQPINDSGQQLNPRYDDNGREIGTQPPPPPNRPFWTSPAPYKIYRQPTPASDEPYQLPEGTAIDLRASGVGSGDYFYVPGIYDNDQNVVVMFAPEGRVSNVTFSTLPTITNGVDTYNQSVVDNVYLLVGRRENTLPLVVNDDQTLQSSYKGLTQDERDRLRQKLNWLLGNARWVVIGSQSGRIVTDELATVDPAAIFDKYTSSPFSHSQSSEDLRNDQIQAAREFTREMSQQGGR